MTTPTGYAVGYNDASIQCFITDGELCFNAQSTTDSPAHGDGAHVWKANLRNCCSPTKPFKSKTIPLYEVLSANSSRDELTITCVRRHRSKSPVKSYVFHIPSGHDCKKLAETVWAAAYGNITRRKRALVLLNPFGGSGKAKFLWNEIASHIFKAALYDIDVLETQYAGHATEMASKLELNKYDMVICVSGDGLAHEVLNGFAKRPDAVEALAMPVGFVPAGSGNASAKSIYNTQKHIECALSIVKGVATPVDLLSMTQGDQRYLSYLSTSFGVIADADLGTEHLRWMGQARFTYGVVRSILLRTAYPCTISLSIATDDKARMKKEYLERNAIAHTSIGRTAATPADEDASFKGLPPLKYGTVKDPLPPDWVTKSFPRMGTFYAGLMPYMSSTACFFPTITPASGLMDVLYIEADIPFLNALKTVGAVDSAKHFDSDYCYYAKCDAFRLVPARDTDLISVDGEKKPCEPIQGEIHHALGMIITKNGKYFSQFSD